VGQEWHVCVQSDGCGRPADFAAVQGGPFDPMTGRIMTPSYGISEHDRRRLAPAQTIHASKKLPGAGNSVEFYLFGTYHYDVTDLTENPEERKWPKEMLEALQDALDKSDKIIFEGDKTMEPNWRDFHQNEKYLLPLDKCPTGDHVASKEIKNKNSRLSQRNPPTARDDAISAQVKLITDARNAGGETMIAQLSRGNFLAKLRYLEPSMIGNLLDQQGLIRRHDTKGKENPTDQEKAEDFNAMVTQNFGHMRAAADTIAKTKGNEDLVRNQFWLGDVHVDEAKLAEELQKGTPEKHVKLNDDTLNKAFVAVGMAHVPDLIDRLRERGYEFVIPGETGAFDGEGAVGDAGCIRPSGEGGRRRMAAARTLASLRALAPQLAQQHRRLKPSLRGEGFCACRQFGAGAANTRATCLCEEPQDDRETFFTKHVQAANCGDLVRNAVKGTTTSTLVAGLGTNCTAPGGITTRTWGATRIGNVEHASVWKSSARFDLLQCRFRNGTWQDDRRFRSCFCVKVTRASDPDCFNMNAWPNPHQVPQCDLHFVTAKDNATAGLCDRNGCTWLREACTSSGIKFAWIHGDSCKECDTDTFSRAAFIGQPRPTRGQPALNNPSCFKPVCPSGEGWEYDNDNDQITCVQCTTGARDAQYKNGTTQQCSPCLKEGCDPGQYRQHCQGDDVGTCVPCGNGFFKANKDAWAEGALPFADGNGCKKCEICKHGIGKDASRAGEMRPDCGTESATPPFGPGSVQKCDQEPQGEEVAFEFFDENEDENE
jgi:hypothetical protein